MIKLEILRFFLKIQLILFTAVLFFPNSAAFENILKNSSVKRAIKRVQTATQIEKVAFSLTGTALFALFIGYLMRPKKIKQLKRTEKAISQEPVQSEKKELGQVPKDLSKDPILNVNGAVNPNDTEKEVNNKSLPPEIKQETDVTSTLNSQKTSPASPDTPRLLRRDSFKLLKMGDVSEKFLEYVLIATTLEDPKTNRSIIDLQESSKTGVIDIFFRDHEQEKNYWIATISAEESPILYVTEALDPSKRKKYGNKSLEQLIFLEKLILVNKNYKRIRNDSNVLTLEFCQTMQDENYKVAYIFPPDRDKNYAIDFLRQQRKIDLLHAIISHLSLSDPTYQFSIKKKGGSGYICGSEKKSEQKNESITLCQIDGSVKNASLLKIIREGCAQNIKENSQHTVEINDEAKLQKFLEHCLRIKLAKNNNDVKIEKMKNQTTILIKKEAPETTSFRYQIDPRITEETAQKIFMSHGLPVLEGKKKK